MARGDREHWERTHARGGGGAPDAPADFLVAHAALIPRGRVLDVAAGGGRNAAWLAALGCRVVAVDGARAALERVRALAPRVACAQMDLDAPGIRAASLDAVVVVNFLDRRLFDEAPGWLRPGGVLVWDTFLVEERAIGHPRNPAFLLERGELARRLAARCDILAAREGLVDGPAGPTYRSGVVARRRAPGG